MERRRLGTSRAKQQHCNESPWASFSFIYPRLAAKKVSNLDIPTSKDKKKPQERPAISPAKGPERSGLARNKTITTPLQLNITMPGKTGLPGCEELPQVLCQKSIRDG